MKTERVTKGGAPRRGARAGDKKLSEPVTLFAAIEAEQHEALRAIAFYERRSLHLAVPRAPPVRGREAVVPTAAE